MGCSVVEGEKSLNRLGWDQSFVTYFIFSQILRNTKSWMTVIAKSYFLYDLGHNKGFRCVIDCKTQAGNSIALFRPKKLPQKLDQRAI